MSHLPPLTPSKAHDRAYKRDAGHDKLQQDVLVFLRGRSLKVVAGTDLIHRSVEAEMPFRRGDGQIIAYADIGEIIDIGLNRIINIYEIKPRIETVFGIIGQAKILLDLAQRMPADVHHVHVVVPHSDPMLSDLRAEWPHTWAWGITYKPVDEE